MQGVARHFKVCTLGVVLVQSCLCQSFCCRVNHIFQCCLLSPSVFDAYEKIAELTIEDSIKNELSGDFERLMLAVGEREGRPLERTE